MSITQPDYNTLIDRETWAFIRHTEDFYPPDAINLSVQQQREVYDRMCREFTTTYPMGVTAVDLMLDSEGHAIGCRRYQRQNQESAAVVLYMHGGGFVVGGLDSHDDVCAEICSRTGFDVLSVDYRLSPEWQHPAAFIDSLAAFAWLLEESPRPIVLCGDSAGGNIAAAIAHHCRDHELPVAGQVLIYPGLGGDICSGSYLLHANAPMLTTADIEFYATIRSRDVAARKLVSYAALNDTNFAALPATVIVSAACDPLSDDGKNYAALITASGGRAHWHNETGLVHGYLRARHTVGRARESFSRIVAALDAVARGQWPY